MNVRFCAIALVLAAIGTTQVRAQTSDPGASGKDKSGVSSSTGGSESLSTKLSNSGGVITPKADVDPGIKVQAPDPHPGSTPVIPPSATGGSSAK